MFANICLARLKQLHQLRLRQPRCLTLKLHLYTRPAVVTDIQYYFTIRSVRTHKAIVLWNGLRV